MHFIPKWINICYLKMLVNYINYKKVIMFILFSLYFAAMIQIYLHYTSLEPSYDSKFINKENLLIDTPNYQLPDFDPFDSSIISYIDPSPNNFGCEEGKRPLTSGFSNYSTSEGSSELISVLVYHDEHKADYGVISSLCCYHPIKSNYSKEDYPDDGYVIEDQCHLVQNDVTRITHEAIYVVCSSLSKVFYERVHFFVQRKSSPYHNKSEQPTERKKDSLSVLVFGLDSISRLNMQRYLPKTREVLKDIDSIEFRGYNKHSENTFPNVMSILTGFNDREIMDYNNFEERGTFFDDIPFIWKNFSDAGYSTVFAEDCSSLTMFHAGGKRGFTKPPTDYFLHPFYKAGEDKIGWKGNLVWISGCKACIGKEASFKVILKYAADVSQIFRQTPHFSVIWSSSLTHDRIHFSGLADDSTADFIRRMYDEGHWNNTIVFFISDHGIRFGSIRKTYIGRLEESLPFGYVVIPTWFKNTYPAVYKNLQQNQYRLTTHSDLHETFIDILHEKYKDEKYINSSYDLNNLNYKLSFFKEIPETRTCASAKIPVNYCAGIRSSPILDSQIVIPIASYIVKFINKGLDNFPDCFKLTKFKINDAYIIHLISNNEEEVDESTQYQVQLTTYPGEAVLEAVVRTKIGTLDYKVMGSINRLNKYEGQSFCVTDTQFVKYCLCRNSTSL